MSNFTLVEGTCIITGETYAVRSGEEGNPPDQFISPPALVALGVLDKNENYDWAKAATIRHPNGLKDWIVEHSENTDSFKDFDLEHGAVYESDLVEGYKETYENSDDPYFRYQGRIKQKVRDGIEDYRVDRSDLDAEVVQEALDELWKIPGEMEEPADQEESS